MTTIKPIFAAFAFRTLRQAREAWQLLDGNPKVRNVSAWTSNPQTPIVVVLGEDPEWVDNAADIIMDAPGCTGNYVLPSPLRRFFIARRYTTLSSELHRRMANGETVEQMMAAGGIRQRQSDLPTERRA